LSVYRDPSRLYRGSFEGLQHLFGMSFLSVFGLFKGTQNSYESRRALLEVHTAFVSACHPRLRVYRAFPEFV